MRRWTGRGNRNYGLIRNALLSRAQDHGLSCSCSVQKVCSRSPTFMEYSLVLIAGIGEPEAYRFSTASELPLTAASTLTTNFISHSLNRCLQEHTTCREFQSQLKPGVNDNWPRRILRIDKKAFTVSLVDFDETMRSKYVALSYCWGPHTDQHLKTTRDTLPFIQAGIHASQLPATLRDAVKVTIGLGRSLIWIDSLCIIQDDEDDWNREAGKMSTVYAQSLVTIIASSAASSISGFLETEREQSIQVSQVCVDDQTAQVRARPLYEWGHHRGGPQAHSDAYMRWFDPVDGRGWTLQERLLSARYINYTSGEVQWGCLSERACECGQELYGELYKPHEPEDEWFRAVEEFSLRRLTAATDRLPALAGIARKLSSAMGSDWYGAGVWLSKQPTPLVARSLLWKRSWTASVSTFPAEHVAPSFSSLSVAGEVWHKSPKEFACGTFDFLVSGVDLSYHSQDIFGRVDRAVLCVEGLLIGGRLSWNAAKRDTGKFSVELEERTQRGTCDVDGLLEAVALPDGRHTARRKLATSGDPEATFEDAEIVLLPIMAYLAGFVRSSVVSYPA